MKKYIKILLFLFYFLYYYFIFCLFVYIIMAPNRVITKRLYLNQNSRNDNVSLDWCHVYNGYPYGSTWNPPKLRIDLIAPSNEPVLYHAQGFGGSASSATFINPVDVVYQPIPGSSPAFPVVANFGYGGYSNYWNNAGYNNNTFYNNLYASGAAWANDFSATNAL